MYIKRGNVKIKTGKQCRIQLDFIENPYRSLKLTIHKH